MSSAPPPPIPLRRLARLVPGAFAKLATRGRSLQPKHLELLDQKLIAVATGKIKRLAAFFPPRHGKSERISRFFPPWFLGHFPDKRVILSSYEADFAASWGRKARDVLTEWGPSVFGVRVRATSSAANRWDIEGHDGGMVTAGVGGAITGKGADVLIVDDPVKNAEEACSKIVREKQWDWWRSTAHTRLEPGGAEILVMTRWHEDDLGGRILREAESDGTPWEVLRLPALAEENDAIGRKLGEALWPARYDVAALEKIRKPSGVGSHWWSALYQQRPAPAEGTIFKAPWFRRYVETVSGFYSLGAGVQARAGELIRFATVDLATSVKTSADYTVIGVWGVRPSDGTLLLLDLHRARLEGPDLIPAMAAMHLRWSLSFIGIERVGFQLAIVQAARRAGLPVRELVPDADKIARAIAATPSFEAGLVYFPEHAEWRGPLEEELLCFPHGAHDDQVDMVSYAVGCAAGLAAVVRDPPVGLEVTAQPRNSFGGASSGYAPNRPGSRRPMYGGD